MPAKSQSRDETAWLRHLYAVIRQRGARLDIDFPEFDAFWAKGWFALPARERAFILMEEFRTDPGAKTHVSQLIDVDKPL